MQPSPTSQAQGEGKQLQRSHAQISLILSPYRQAPAVPVQHERTTAITQGCFRFLYPSTLGAPDGDALKDSAPSAVGSPTKSEQVLPLESVSQLPCPQPPVLPPLPPPAPSLKLPSTQAQLLVRGFSSGAFPPTAEQERFHLTHFTHCPGEAHFLPQGEIAISLAFPTSPTFSAQIWR